MPIKHAGIDLPAAVDFVGESGSGQNVEGEILSLRSAHVRMTVDPTQTEPAGKIRNNSPVRAHKIITAPEVDAEIMIFHAANDRFRHQGETKLVVTTRPVLAIVHSP